MGFWETAEEIGKKVPEILNSLKELAKDENFQKHLSQAGTIGNLCLIGFEIYKKIKKDLDSLDPEKQAFGALINVIFECTKQVLPQNKRIEIRKDLVDMQKEDLINDLFDIFIEKGYKWEDGDLPSHPVIERYRKQIHYIIKANNIYNNEVIADLTKFFMDFNILLEDKATNDKNIKRYYHKTELRKLSEDLREYMEYVRSMKDELNPVDNKSFILTS